MKDQSSDKSTAMKHDLREKADAMAAAFHKLLTDLAKDGTAIEGFTAAWNAHLEYNHAVINYELARLSVAPEPSLEKPDFAVRAERYADAIDRRLTSYHEGIKKGYWVACEELWIEYVIPLQNALVGGMYSEQCKKIESLQKEIEELRKKENN